MTDYQISQRATGAILGTFSGDTVGQALDAYARDAGYRSYADLAETIGRTIDEARAELRVDAVE